MNAPPVCKVFAVCKRFKVAVSVDGRVHEVTPLRTKTEAAVVCDAVTVYQALHAGRSVRASKLRFKDGKPEVRDALLQEYGSGALAGSGAQPEPLLALVQQLADCAGTIDVADEVPPPDVVAADLLGAAVARGHDAALMALLLVNPSAALAERLMWGEAGISEFTVSLLHLAAQYRNSTATKLLLAAAPSLATKDSELGFLPLHVAAENGHTEVVQQLLDAAPQAALVADEEGLLPLHTSAKFGNTSVVQQLLDAAPQAALAADEEGLLPLHMAAEEGHLVVVQQLLDAAPQVILAADENGLLPLHLAACNRHTAVVQQLLDAAPQATLAADEDGLLPLHFSAKLGNTSVVQQLLDAAPQAALVADEDGFLPLHAAAEEGHATVVRQLLDAAPQAAFVADVDGMLPLHLAANRGYTAAVQQLLDAAPQAALVAKRDGCLPLHCAAKEGHLAVVQELLDAAPQAASVATQAGYLPLQLALLYDHGMIAEILLRSAAAPRHLDLSTLLAAGPEWHHLLPLFVSARAPLFDAEWEFVPAPCPGILRALPAALACSAEQAREVARRLSLSEARRLRVALQWLHVSQHRSGVTLPFDIFLCILFNALDCNA